MWLGYIFSLFGTFPILTAWTKRVGYGANWRPLYPLDSIDDLSNKKVLVFENDVVTGRTLKRAMRELQALNPQSIDLLLSYGHTEVSRSNYDKWKHYFKEEVRVLGHSYGDICLDTNCQIPEGFHRVKSLEKDFNSSRDALHFLEDNLIVQRR